ncbi:hypothetical protein BKP42_68510 [Rhodococcus erythropolis]|nr:hypothetical protein BKP42_68510 [Rhodococcus erythropolis]
MHSCVAGSHTSGGSTGGVVPGTTKLFTNTPPTTSASTFTEYVTVLLSPAARVPVTEKPSLPTIVAANGASAVKPLSAPLSTT